MLEQHGIRKWLRCSFCNKVIEDQKGYATLYIMSNVYTEDDTSRFCTPNCLYEAVKQAINPNFYTPGMRRDRDYVNSLMLDTEANFVESNKLASVDNERC